MATSETSDKRPDWLKRKHSKQRRDTYCALIRDALADGKPRTISTATGDDGTERPIGSHDEALAVKNLLYTCNRYMQETSIPKPDIAQRADGTWEIQFTVRSKAEGRAHIAAKPRSEWAYDPAANATQPGTRRPSARQVAEQQQAAAAAAVYRDHLETRQPGGSTDIRDWMVDHGHAPPRNNRDRQIMGQLQAAKRQRQHEGAPADTQPQAPPGSAAAAILAWWKH